MNKLYKILDCDGVEMPGVRSLDAAERLLVRLNRNGEFKPYHVVPCDIDASRPPLVINGIDFNAELDLAKTMVRLYIDRRYEIIKHIYDLREYGIYMVEPKQQDSVSASAWAILMCGMPNFLVRTNPKAE